MRLPTSSVLIATSLFALRSQALPHPQGTTYSVVNVAGSPTSAIPTTVYRTTTQSTVLQETQTTTTSVPVEPASTANSDGYGSSWAPAPTIAASPTFTFWGPPEGVPTGWAPPNAPHPPPGSEPQGPPAGAPTGPPAQIPTSPPSSPSPFVAPTTASSPTTSPTSSPSPFVAPAAASSPTTSPASVAWASTPTISVWTSTSSTDPCTVTTSMHTSSITAIDPVSTDEAVVYSASTWVYASGKWSNSYAIKSSGLPDPGMPAGTGSGWAHATGGYYPKRAVPTGYNPYGAPTGYRPAPTGYWPAPPGNTQADPVAPSCRDV